MARVARGKARARTAPQWVDLPSGGVLQVHRGLTPDGLRLDLEVIVVGSTTKWLWLLQNGTALRFVVAGES